MERGIVSINRKMPGPSIFVCQGDTIVVDVSNEMEGMSATIHWHGFRQTRSPWMDGVPMVTQCPIEADTTFRYRFEAEEAGTHWYHSHSGYHMANGHLGAAVVRTPLDVNAALYDFDLSEHVMLISDWTLDSVERWVPGQQSSQMTVDSILINGRGRYVKVGKAIEDWVFEIYSFDLVTCLFSCMHAICLNKVLCQLLSLEQIFIMKIIE